jgi:hypothetical protein
MKRITHSRIKCSETHEEFRQLNEELERVNEDSQFSTFIQELLHQKVKSLHTEPHVAKEFVTGLCSKVLQSEYNWLAGGAKISISIMLPNVKVVLLDAMIAKFPDKNPKQLAVFLSRRFTLAGDDLSKKNKGPRNTQQMQRTDRTGEQPVTNTVGGQSGNVQHSGGKSVPNGPEAVRDPVAGVSGDVQEDNKANETSQKKTTTETPARIDLRSVSPTLKKD